MQLPNSDVFTKISNIQEKIKLFEYLAVNRAELHARLIDSNASLFTLKAFRLESQQLHCSFHGMQKPNLESHGEVVLNFLAASEKYFIKANYKLSLNNVVINTETDLYHLQRREDYRIKIPKGYKAQVELASINGKPSLERLTLDDLSAGGCRLSVKKDLVKQGDILEALLILPMKNPIPCSIEVKHISANFQLKDFEFAGTQFSKMSEINKNKLSATVMDIYREFFLSATS